MKAVLEFDLSKEEDSDRFELINNAEKMSSFIWAFQAYLRSEYKYKETPDNIEKIYESWFEYLNEYKVSTE